MKTLIAEASFIAFLSRDIYHRLLYLPGFLIIISLFTQNNTDNAVL